MSKLRTISKEETSVPLPDGEEVTISPGQPWPSAYRGSKYSLVSSRQHGEVTRWQYKDLNAQAHPPEGLLEAFQDMGKDHGVGKGSFRVTAGGEILTKVNASDYPRLDEAPVSNGWIPVYIGKLQGTLGFDQIALRPSLESSDDIWIWTGFPFNHGERWSVSHSGSLIWTWRDYTFESAFDHPELIEKYERYRRTAGRLYINEYGHIFVNAPQSEIPTDAVDDVLSVYERWKSDAEKRNKTAELRLVNRRLKVTSTDDDPMNGHLPLYIGHLDQFDDGVVPRPVVEDPSYYRVCAKGIEQHG